MNNAKVGPAPANSASANSAPANKLYIMVGFPGSGKSTWARGQIADWADLYCVSRDSLRFMVGAGEYRFEKGKLEGMIKGMAYASATVLLCAGSVIMDEINLTVAARAELIALAREVNAIPTIVWCKEGDMETCLNRRMKDNPRGYDRAKWEEVIRGMMERFESPTEAECEILVVK